METPVKKSKLIEDTQSCRSDHGAKIKGETHHQRNSIDKTQNSKRMRLSHRMDVDQGQASSIGTEPCNSYDASSANSHNKHEGDVYDIVRHKSSRMKSRHRANTRSLSPKFTSDTADTCHTSSRKLLQDVIEDESSVKRRGYPTNDLANLRDENEANTRSASSKLTPRNDADDCRSKCSSPADEDRGTYSGFPAEDLEGCLFPNADPLGVDGPGNPWRRKQLRRRRRSRRQGSEGTIRAARNKGQCMELGGRTPLHLAIELGYTNIVEILVEAGADVNSLDEFGRTPLHLAGEMGNKGLAKVLLSAGAVSVDGAPNMPGSSCTRSP